MKPAALLVLAALAWAGAAAAEPLNDKSKAPEWALANQDEKDAWLSAFEFKQGDVDRAAVGECLDKHAGKPLFETNDLTGVTQMCGTIAALPQ